MRAYHYGKNVPPGVRKEVAAGWESMWRRLRRSFPYASDRCLELKTGTLLRVGLRAYRVRYVDGDGDGRLWTPQPRGFYVRLADSWPPVEKYVEGLSIFGHGKPYIYLDDLQDALDSLEVEGVMGA